MKNRPSIMLITALLISGCGVTPSNYESNSPSLNFSEFFDGRLCAWGLVRDRSSEMTRKFVARIDASTLEQETQLLEWFKFSDNEIQKRHWRFKAAGNELSGKAGDVEGEASGRIWGDSLQLKYVLNIQVEDETWQIAMDDWLHLIDENTLLGSTQMTKWGLDVGRIDISIQKRQANDKCSISDDEISQSIVNQNKVELFGDLNDKKDV